MGHISLLQIHKRFNRLSGRHPIMQKTYAYVTLIRVSGNNRSLTSALRSFPRKTKNCTILGTWTTFGEYDGLVQFIATSNEDAMRFVTQYIRPIQNVVSAETLPLVTQQSYINQIPK